MSDVFQKYDGENSETRAVDYLQSQVSATFPLLTCLNSSDNQYDAKQVLTRFENRETHCAITSCVYRHILWTNFPLSH